MIFSPENRVQQRKIFNLYEFNQTKYTLIFSQVFRLKGLSRMTFDLLNGIKTLIDCYGYGSLIIYEK